MTLKETIQAVETFHNAFGIENNETPTVDLSENDIKLRHRLMHEENEEYLEAAENGVNIVENPVINTLTLNYELTKAETADLNIYVLSIGGEIKASQAQQAAKGSNQIQLDVAHLESGIYLLQVRTKHEIKTLKFVK